MPSTKNHHVCPIAKVAELIGDYSSMLIIRDLLTGPKRFGDLTSSLAGTSTRTLTNKLKKLEGHKLIKREEFSEKPPRVMYSLTPKGQGLHNIAESMRKYGEKYL